MMATHSQDDDDHVEGNDDDFQPIQLGFSEPIQDELHLNNVAHRNSNYDHWDGGQIGGVCSWLNPEHLPKPIHCSNCQTQMFFICQLYAPLDGVENAFHRSLYVFGCPLCQDPLHSIKVLRTQLPRDNPYYPSEPCEDDPDWRQNLPDTWNQHTCGVCGMLAKAKCPLQQKFFCCKEHQKEHKRHVFDKEGDDSQDQLLITQLPSVYAMSDLVVEEEPAITEASDKETNAMFPTVEPDSDDSSDSDQDLEQDDLNEIVVGKRDKTKVDISQDPYAMNFYSRIKNRPQVQTQCLRYCRWPREDSVLWIQEHTRLVDDPAPCELCSAPRRFEFQILPQMLHFLLAGRPNKVEKPSDAVASALEQTESWVQQAPPEHIPPGLIEAKQAALERIQRNLMESVLDWGVIAVYTCTSSCTPPLDSKLGAYCTEFAWRQPSLDTPIPNCAA
jgi:pre-rRNA-processing protein TSR4